jgi:two-component system sensor histidine kinase/response regulator
MNQTTPAQTSVQPRVSDLAAALKRMESNVPLVREMLRLFVEDAPIYQSRMERAIAQRDSDGVEHAAHSLKGMLSMFGAEAAMQVAYRLERMGHDSDLAAAPAQIRELDHEISRFLKTFTAELANL